MKRTKTPWFPGHIYPVRNGVYERNFDAPHRPRPHYCKFEDGEWYAFGATVEDAAAETYIVPNHWLEWRGLQGDEHSLEIGASTYLVEFGDEGPDRPRDDE